MRTPIRIAINVKTAVRWRTMRTEDNVWIGVCDSLNLVVEGDSQSEMVEAAEQAITLLIQDLIHENDIGAFLRKQGWRPARRIPKSTSGIKFDVPLELVMENEKVRSRRASTQ
jgi:predicted RNase H-like HicB family nuclease